MKYEILNAKNEYIKWQNLISSFHTDFQDIYFKPEFLLMCSKEKSEPLMYFYEEGNNFWCYSFLKNQIDNNLIHCENDSFYDIETPYGYGGPLSNSNEPKFLKNAQHNFFEWCNTNNIVAEFVRFHPIIKNQKYYNNLDSVELNRLTISYSFQDRESINVNYDSKTRNMIKNFKKNNLNCIVTKSFHRYCQFVDLYKKIIADKDTSKFYLFGDKYFSLLYDVLCKNGWLICIENESDEFIGGSIFLQGKQFSHYHLSATERTREYSGINNVILDLAINKAKESNLKSIHLGGGNSSSPNDTLFKFKEKMGNTKNEFYIGRKIYNKNIYQLIKKNWENQGNINNSDKILFYKDN